MTNKEWITRNISPRMISELKADAVLELCNQLQREFPCEIHSSHLNFIKSFAGKLKTGRLK